MLKHFLTSLEAEALDFAPPLLRSQHAPPHPMSQKVLRVAMLMLSMLIVWAIFGRLDIVAVAEGKLVPQTYLKIVQPLESGIVQEIRVHEGETVHAGQVLMRMDALVTEADGRALNAELQRKRITLRRIDAELSGKPFRVGANDLPSLSREIQAQYRADNLAQQAALAEERTRLVKARVELSAAEQVKAKLAAVLPHYLQQELAFDKLAQDKFAGPLMASDKRRERIEKESELKTQEHMVESARASIAQSEKKLVQLESDYLRQLHTERNTTQGEVDKLAQEVAKQQHKQSLLELKSPQDGVVKDIATHTVGTVVQPGTVMLTLVPVNEKLRAEVMVTNADIGFVRIGQPVKVKFAAFPFQKYGMMTGTVEHVSADAQDSSTQEASMGVEPGRRDKPLAYKALVKLDAM
ncbi:MAG: HlyD family type I secretion periplasmic adaptor subunit, partial [Methylotenera sp.]